VNREGLPLLNTVQTEVHQNLKANHTRNLLFMWCYLFITRSQVIEK